MSEVAAIISAVTGAVVALGGGVAWLWQRVEKGFSNVEDELAKCRAREVASSKREMALAVQIRETANKHLIVIELLWQVAAKSKASQPVLARCKEHLDELKIRTKELAENE